MLTRAQVIGWRNALFAIFSLSGLGLSSWVARTPAVRDSLHAGTQEMGWIVFALAGGSIVGLTLSSHALARLGSVSTIAGSTLASAVGLVLTGLGATLFSTPLMVVAGLALFGAGAGMCDVAMNVEGAANERALQRNVMPWFHAAFSIGTVIGAGVGALAELAHIPIAVHLGTIAVGMTVAVLRAVRKLQPHPDAPASSGGTGEHGEPDAGWRDRLLIWRERRTLLIGLVILGMAFAEGSANDWLALAMVDGHSVSNATGAVVFGVFVAAMTVGRIAGVPLLDRFGRVPVVRASAWLAAFGLIVVIVVPSALVATLGVLCWGLGAALGFPVSMSAAADDPRTAAARVSAIATMGYFAFLVGPPSIGFLGGHIGLLHALLLVLVLVAVAGVASGAVREGTGAAAAARRAG